MMLSPSVLNSTRGAAVLADLLLGPLDHAVALAGLRDITLPVPVILKRFLAPDLVFSLGILLSFRCGIGHGQTAGPAG